MWAFAKSVLLGTIAASCIPSVLTFFVAIGSLLEELRGDGRFWPFVWLAILPTVISLPIVLGASVVFGLPLTLLLRWYQRESEVAYAISGAVLGAAISGAILLLLGDTFNIGMSALGALSGAMTARTWWRTAREPLCR